MKTLYFIFLGMLVSIALQAQPSYYGPNYVHANSGTNCFSDYTLLNTSSIGNTSTDKIIFTHVWGIGANNHDEYMRHSNGLWYTGTQWSIFDETQASIDTNWAYFVLNCKTNGTSFTHTVTSGNVVLNWSLIDNAALNGNPNAVFFITKTWDNGVYDTAHVGVWYDVSASKWTIYNENSSGTLQLNSTYNIFVPNTGTSYFKQVATSTYYTTVIDNPLTNGNPDARLFVDHDYTNTSGSEGYVNDEIGVYYDGTHWTIYTESISDLWAGATFNVMVIANNPVGVKENQNISAGLKLSPNPARDFVLISTADKTTEIKSISLTSMDGRLVLEKETLFSGAQPNRLDISGLGSGLYILTATTDKGPVTGRLNIVK